MDLFDRSQELKPAAEGPLAYRLRPRTLDEFVGQEHLVGPGRLLNLALLEDRPPSAIFYGPPGTGKTSLAGIIAEATGACFIQLDASSSGVADLRKVLSEARERLQSMGEAPAPLRAEPRRAGVPTLAGCPSGGGEPGTRRLGGTGAGTRRTLLFIDEIHRFNKAQQDVLLPAVEKGVIVLIGATTENPYFSVNAPLLSRTRVLPFYPLQPEHLRQILEWALTDAERGLGRLRIEVAPEAVEHWLRIAGGDARILLNALEAAVGIARTTGDSVIRVGGDEAAQAVQQRILLYDRDGDTHYDVISAFIKSMRGSDPDAVLHWLARMLRAGEDPRFIARRIVICAAEDVGLADPQALVVANAAAQGIEYVGLPEGELLLAEAAVYVACAPKSNRVYRGLTAARQDLEQADIGTVPKHLRDANYRSAKKLGHGQGYLYPHNYPGAHVAQQYLPDALQGKKYYEPSESGRERDIKLRRAHGAGEPALEGRAPGGHLSPHHKQ